jgi:hypothetical protein
MRRDQADPLRQGHHRDQPGPRHEIRVIKRRVHPGQAMQQSHLRGALSNETTEASDIPIVPVQRAPFTLPRSEATLFDRWIEAYQPWVEPVFGWAARQDVCWSHRDLA